MPNHRKTLSRHLTNGSYRRDRYGRRPPSGAGIGPAPKHIAELTGIWGELAAAPLPGAGSEHDRVLFELMVRLVERTREGKATSAASRNCVNCCARSG